MVGPRRVALLVASQPGLLKACTLVLGSHLKVWFGWAFASGRPYRLSLSPFPLLPLPYSCFQSAFFFFLLSLYPEYWKIAIGNLNYFKEIFKIFSFTLTFDFRTFWFGIPAGLNPVSTFGLLVFCLLPVFIEHTCNVASAMPNFYQNYLRLNSLARFMQE